MVAVTIISPSYAEIGAEAVRRFEKHTGLRVQVIECPDSEGFVTKLELDRHLPQGPWVFFDADWWMLRDADLSRMPSQAFMAVHDSAAFNPNAFPHTDCQNFGMPKSEYFNSGLMFGNFALESHRGMFRCARLLRSQVLRQQLPAPTDVTDQFYLNRARFDVGIPLSRLPTTWNFYMKAAQWGQLPAIPRSIIGLHAAGAVLADKLECLTDQAKVFGVEFGRVHREVEEFENARIHEFR